MRDQIKKIVEEYLKDHNLFSIKQYLKCYHKQLFDFIINETSILNANYPFQHRLYWVIHDIHDFPLCELCRKPNKRKITFDKGYSDNYKYCCHKCCVSSSECTEKRKKTNLERFGVEAPAQSIVIQNKIKQTCLERFGEITNLKCEDTKNKIKQTCLEKYGVDHISKTKQFSDMMTEVHKNRTDTVKQNIIDKSKKTKLERYGDENFSNRDKARKTSLERFGHEYAMQSDICKDKVIKSNLEKYGTRWSVQSPEVREKIKNTNLQKYGYESYVRSEDFKIKTKNSNLIHYGTEWSLQSPEVREKIKNTNLQKYGVSSASKNNQVKNKVRMTMINRYGKMFTQTDEYKIKTILTNLEKYGTEWALQASQIREKSRLTNLKKYGIDNIFKSQIFKDKMKIIKLTKTYNRLLKNESVQPLFSLEEFLSDPFRSDFKWKCLHCGKEFQSPRSGTLKIEDSLYARCYDCFPSTGHSVPEKIIYDLIKKLNFECILGNKTLIYPKELDIYIPSKKLAIEFDGLYWHSNMMLRNDHNYHLDKTETLQKQGIQLIHIFEDEWMFKQNIVISRIYNLLGIYNNIIYARTCEVKKVNDFDSRQFLIENHIQGTCNSKYRYGLYYNNELVALMTFGNYRKSLGRLKIEGEYELLRFCCKLGYHIPGAASKLLKYFINDNKPHKIISYADRRWSQGKLYEALGFSFVRNTSPNYWYVIGNKREHRFAWRKSILESKLEQFNPSKTEYENMLDNNIDCIYDCGSILYEKFFN